MSSQSNWKGLFGWFSRFARIHSRSVLTRITGHYSLYETFPHASIRPRLDSLQLSTIQPLERQLGGAWDSSSLDAHNRELAFVVRNRSIRCSGHL